MVLLRGNCSLLAKDLTSLLCRSTQLGRALSHFCFAVRNETTRVPCSFLVASCRQHNTFRRFPPPRDPNRRSDQPALEDEPFAEDKDYALLQHLRRRIEEQRAEARNEPLGSFKNRRLKKSVENLTATMTELLKKRQQKKNESADTNIQKSPSNAFIEVLSNGTDNVRPCVALKTTFQVYLFDCPEGIYRHMCGTRLNHKNLNDVFISRGDWEHTGGVSGVIVSKESLRQKLRLHGPPHMKRFVETFRCFRNEEGEERSLLEVEELTFDQGRYEDEALVVHYLPLVETALPTNDPFMPSKRRPKYDEVGKVSLAYLVEFKKRPWRIDAAKCLALQVPKGPMIGQLQRGMDVTLPNGQVVKPEDVRLVVDGDDQCEPAVFVVNCPSLPLVQALVSAPALQRYKNPDTSNPLAPFLKYVVHYTKEDVLRSDKYSKWMASFGLNTTHIVVNGSGPMLPHSEGIYRMQTQLHFLHPHIFPQLRTHGFSGSLPTAVPETPLGETKIIMAEPFMSFIVRGRPLPEEESTNADFDRDAAISAAKGSTNFDSLYAAFRKEADSLTVKETYPRLTVLGSSSASPTKYRNVSGYLLELNDDFCCMVDCGEGSYGQMLTLYGQERTDELLRKLKFIFISHGHQDHLIGVPEVILERRKAINAAGEKFAPLRLLGPTIMFPALNMYDMSIEKLSGCFEATITTKPRTQQEVASEMWDKHGVIDIGSYIPDFDSWPLTQLQVVTVRHPRQAKGLILVTTDGKKLVFSGDAKPSDRLVRAGTDADLLVHEATFSDEFKTDADKKSHSTTGQAVEVGEQMKAKIVLLTHFSARHPKIPLLPTYLDAKGNVGIAMDSMVVRWSEFPLLPKLLPLFRSIYSDEIDYFKTQIIKRSHNVKSKLDPTGQATDEVAKKTQRVR